MRYDQIDFFRGLMLILMSLDHTGGPINFLSSQPFGFVSAAEGFVFLSGLTAGIVYSRKYTQIGSVETSRLVWKRAWKIYYYHAGLMLFLITASILVPPIRDFFWTESNNFLDHLPSLTFGALILKVQPLFHDILPMYVIFMVFTPFLLWMCHTLKMPWIIAGTLTFWMAVQVIWYLFPALSSYTPGSFNPFAWQFLFFIGVLLGYLMYLDNLGSLLGNRTLLRTSVALSVVLMVFDWLSKFETIDALNIAYFDSDVFQYIADRKNLGILRLINLTALIFSISCILRKHGTWGQNRWICLLGRNSLQVFTFHIVLMTITKPVIEHIFNAFPTSMLTHPSPASVVAVLVYIFIPALTTLMLWIPALYMENRKIAFKVSG